MRSWASIRNGRRRAPLLLRPASEQVQIPQPARTDLVLLERTRDARANDERHLSAVPEQARPFGPRSARESRNRSAAPVEQYYLGLHPGRAIPAEHPPQSL